MSVTVINPSGSQNYQAILSCERFQEFTAVFNERTGRAYVLEFNKDGERISWMHPESTQRLGFFVDFFRVGFSSSDGFEAAIENLARRYAELLDELRERYADDEYELYKQISELNQAFETALHSTVMLPHVEPPRDSWASSSMMQGLRNSIEQQWQEHNNLKSIMQHLKDNMLRHLDTFFETFIKSIQSNNFEAAFASSMDILNNTESTSLANISFRDTVAIRNTLNQGRLEENEEGEKVFILNSRIHSMQMVVADTGISETIRRELAELLGFRWRENR